MQRTAMSAPNPLETAHSTPPPTISSQTYHIAGILTTIYGLLELPRPCDNVACLWLLHPRLQTKETMSPVASSMICSWNMRRPKKSRQGLIAVAFDQRNHGTREVDKIANEAWRSGNPRHAQDMFSIFHGTALDTGLLIDHLGSYIFVEKGGPKIERHFVLGISLGGHAAWQAVFHEPRIEAAVIIIGCPDYMRVMEDRARLSKLETYTLSNGADFLGSRDFPSALVASCQKWDPKALLFGVDDIKSDPSPLEQNRLRKALDAKVKGKSILVCSGGADKLVPYHCSAPFMKFLKKATKGWYSEGNVYVEDNVYNDVGHAFSEGMARDAERFLGDLLEEKDLKTGSKTSRI